METNGLEPGRNEPAGRSKLLVGSTLTLAILIAVGLLISGAWVSPAHRANATLETQPGVEIGPLAFRAVTRIRAQPRDLLDANSKRALHDDIRSSLAQAQHALVHEFKTP
ncbi:hypothetical protein MK489_22900 [Myxococcota bacterium]|nr:hypothetical protein [Myxococcota bacterium]